MFGSIGVPELLMIFVVALLLFGPRKLPDIGRSLGKAMGEFRRASNDLKRTLEEEVAVDHLRDVDREVREATRAPYEPPAPATAPAADSAATAEGPPQAADGASPGPETETAGPAQQEEGEKAPPVEPR